MELFLHIRGTFRVLKGGHEYEKRGRARSRIFGGFEAYVCFCSENEVGPLGVGLAVGREGGWV